MPRSFQKLLSAGRSVAPRGFTLVEVIVVVAVILIITSIILFRYGAFEGNVLLRDLAYDIALSIRQAQTYGLSVRELPLEGVAEFDIGYGMYFDAANPDQYILFADRNRNEEYDDATENVEVYTIRGKNTISGLCTLDGESETCSLSSLTVVFERPNPDALVHPNNDSGATEAYGRVYVTSGSGNTQTILVSATGQISVGGTVDEEAFVQYGVWTDAGSGSCVSSNRLPDVVEGQTCSPLSSTGYDNYTSISCFFSCLLGGRCIYSDPMSCELD